MVAVNEMDHDEMVVTAADFWLARFPNRARWALASKPTMCAYQGLGLCTAGSGVPAVEVGEPYLFTGDVIRTPLIVPICLCESCADSEIPDEAFAIA